MGTLHRHRESGGFAFTRKKAVAGIGEADFAQITHPLFKLICEPVQRIGRSVSDEPHGHVHPVFGCPFPERQFLFIPDQRFTQVLRYFKRDEDALHGIFVDHGCTSFRGVWSKVWKK